MLRTRELCYNAHCRYQPLTVENKYRKTLKLLKRRSRRFRMKALPYLKRMLAAGVVALALVLFVIFPSYAATSAQQSDKFLPKDKFTIKSVLNVDLTRDFATLPLHKGNFQGTPVWYVITDASDASVARTLGLNFAP